jgi:hypothetical protein
MTETSTRPRAVIDEFGLDPADSGIEIDFDVAIEVGELAPSAPTMSRAAREQVRRSRRRRNEVIAAGVALVMGAVAALVPSPLATNHGHSAARPSIAAVPPSPPRAVLIAHYDRARHIDMAALVGVNAGGRTGLFEFLPAPTVVDVPSLELQPVGSLLQVGDRALLVNVIENTTGVKLNAGAVFDNDTLARVFAAVPSLTLTLPHAVNVTDAAGTLSFPAGRVVGMAPSQAVRLLVDTEPGGTLIHLATAQAIFQGYFDALRASPAASRRARAVKGAAPFVGLAGVAGMHYDVLPVTSSDAADGERFEIRTSDLDQVVRADFGFARLGGQGTRPRVELLNGVGTAGLMQQVAKIVVPAGGNVTLTNNVEGFNEHKTRVVYYDDSQYATARKFARVLGATSVVKGAIPLDSVDITVVIGSDFVKKPKVAHR